MTTPSKKGEKKLDEISQRKREYREQQWMELIRGRQHSGQTVKAYCETNGVKVKAYYYWLRKVRMKLCVTLRNKAEQELRNK